MNISRILIVDDNPANLDVLYLHLEKAGYLVMVANDGTEALELVLDTQPDIILLDIMMPALDGFQVAMQLKKDPITSEIPIIFMTALTEVDNKVKAFDVGGVDYITKPFQEREMLARVQTHLTLGQQRKELKRQARMLWKRNEDLDAFAHTVAHDLKNPLQIILLHTEFLQKIETLGPKGETYTNVLLETSLKMFDIIDELQLLARIRKEEIKVEPINMQDHIEQALARLQHMLTTYKPEIHIQAMCSAAQGYGPWIEEVWVNYLSNGMKYGGSPPVLIIGGENQGDGYARFWVRDNGRGVLPENHDHIFTKSVQLDNKSNDGHGLGLSIVKRIVEKLDGEVGVTDSCEQGSEFYFTLPINTPL